MNQNLSRRTFLAVGAITPFAIVDGAHARQASPAATPGTPITTEGDTQLTIDANKALVAEATNAFFNQHDAAAVDRFIGETYVQHSALVADGRDAFRDFIASLGEGVAYENVRLLGDGDLVAAHGRYTGFGEPPLVGIDIFRVAGGKLVEHWDGLQPEAEPNPSGHTMLDGPAEVTQPDQTEASRQVAEAFVDAVLIGGQYDRLPEFVSTEAYIQHNPQIADGLDGLGVAVQALADQGISMVYNARHRTIAEGEFVLVQSDGDFVRPVIYNDLFRIVDGKIVEHWDVIQDQVSDLPHNNGQF